MRLIDADALDYELGASDRDIYVKYTLEEAPTIDAIPVEWLREFDKYYGGGCINVNTILTAWQKEQEANNESDKP